MKPFNLVMLPPQDETTRQWASDLADRFPDVTVVVAEDDQQAIEALREADAAYGTITPQQLAVAPSLKWLQAPAAAPPAGYFFEDLITHPVVVTNFRGIYNDHVATHAVAMVLGLARAFHRYIPNQSSGEWKPERGPETVVHLPEAEALIVGLGGIGSEIARMLKAFGCRVTATDARVSEAPVFVDRLAAPDDIDRLIPTADFVVLTVPHTPATEGLINQRRLSSMKETAYLVNIGRGKTVRLNDLVEALNAGVIAGAALDVFEIEPLPRNHPLWGMPNVLLTPHVAVAGPYIEQRRFDVLADNVGRFGEGKPLRNVVDKASWF